MGLLDTVQHHVGDHMGYSAAIKEVMVRAKSKIVKTDSRGREQHKDLIEYQKTRRRVSQPKSQADAEAKAKLAEQQIMPREEDSFIASQDDVDEEFMAKDQQRRQERTRPLPDTESHKPPTEKAPRKPKKALTLGLTRVRRDGEELLSKSIDINKDSTNQRIRKRVSDVTKDIEDIVRIDGGKLKMLLPGRPNGGYILDVEKVQLSCNCMDYLKRRKGGKTTAKKTICKHLESLLDILDLTNIHEQRNRASKVTVEDRKMIRAKVDKLLKNGFKEFIASKNNRTLATTGEDTPLIQNKKKNNGHREKRSKHIELPAPPTIDTRFPSEYQFKKAKNLMDPYSVQWSIGVAQNSRSCCPYPRHMREGKESSKISKGDAVLRCDYLESYPVKRGQSGGNFKIKTTKRLFHMSPSCTNLGYDDRNNLRGPTEFLTPCNCPDCKDAQEVAKLIFPSNILEKNPNLIPIDETHETLNLSLFGNLNVDDEIEMAKMAEKAEESYNTELVVGKRLPPPGQLSSADDTKSDVSNSNVYFSIIFL